MDMKLLFFDVDETLFDKTVLLIPPSAIDAIHQAKTNGHKVFINTGRPYSYIEKELIDIGFDGVICSNGLDIHLDGKNILHLPLPDDAATALRDAAWEYNMTGCLQGQSCTYFRDNNKDFHPYFTTLIEDFERNPYMNHKYTWENFIAYEKGVFFAGADSDLPGFVRSIEAMDFDFDCISINESHVEVLQKGYDKDTGMLAMAKHFGTDASDCFAFGDSNNDTRALQVAGTGIAMGNASDDLKKVADYITSDIDDDGIYHGLKHFGLI